MTLGDVFYANRFRKTQNEFLNQIDHLIDWRPIRKLINSKYKKRQDAVGAPAYDVILLFKMLLLQTWYNLSDVALEERVNDSITFSRFLGLSLEELSPDHSTISRFRTALAKLGLMDALLNAVNEQLERSDGCPFECRKRAIRAAPHFYPGGCASGCQYCGHSSQAEWSDYDRGGR